MRSHAPRFDTKTPCSPVQTPANAQAVLPKGARAGGQVRETKKAQEAMLEVTKKEKEAVGLRQQIVSLEIEVPPPHTAAHPPRPPHLLQLAPFWASKKPDCCARCVIC